METLWSDDYMRRQELMQTLEVPTISEVKLVAGLPLALVLFEECHPDLQEDFGLTPYLQGPGDELWVSPSDLLIGKVALTPPLTQKHIQALTHQGILEIGAEIEQKFLNEMRIEKEKAVQEREDYLLKMFEVQKDKLVAEAREEEQSRYAQEMDEMRLYFENKISQLLWECYEQVQQLEEQMQIEIDSLNVLWQARLEEEIQDTVEKITEEFLEKLRLQEQVLVSIFTKQINENVEKYLETERSSLEDEELEESDVLPAFYFNEKMYVREDFRGRFSAGVEIDQKHSLWNADVEELLNIFKQSIGQKLDCQIDKVKSHHSSVHFSHEHSSDESVLSRENQILTISPQISPPSRPTSPLEIPKLSPVQLQEIIPMALSAANKLESVDDDDEREIRKVSLGGSTSIDYKDAKKDNKKNRRLSINKNISARNSIKSQEGVIKPMGTSSMTQSRLTLARDSIILHISTMERKSIQIMSKIADETLSKISTEKEKNVSTSRSTNEEIVEQTSQEIIEKQDEIKSLEGTFSFDTQDNDPDLEKCMSFWKSILSKNVKPIKCTLLKSKKPKEKVDKEEKTKLKPCEDEETKKMWLNIYKDLQRRKLDKLKLMKKQICDPCADYIDEEYEKKQEKEDIQKLNNWTSQNKPSRFGKSDVRSQIQRTLKVLQAARNSKDIQKSSETVPPSQLKKEPSTAPVTSSQNEQSVRSNHLITSSKEKLQSRSIQSFETKLAMEKSRERVVTRKQLEICCTCGCAVEECICAEISDVIGVEGLKHEKIIPKGREKFADCCRPCSCSVDCVCDEFTDQNQVCSCGYVPESEDQDEQIPEINEFLFWQTPDDLYDDDDDPEKQEETSQEEFPNS
ncbi:hypothetical protein GEV33_013280 [Tenebrio molitor]|uniref:Uncharacterized protein n=1 Tax=Tenebrio molitor TaxID=7067 RepID=A0A8J6LDY2_TENMO|nr:hypothetical protein GEV33_013280 [Tenebrio molitor]